MNKIISIILALCIFTPFNSTAASFTFFTKPLYEEPFAFPRTPDTSVSVNTSKYLDERVGYLEVSLGKDIPIVNMQMYDVINRSLIFQFGLAAGFWGTLGYNNGAFPLLTEDFLISAPLKFKWGNISGAVKFNHISAHQGDGFENLLEGKLSREDKEDLKRAEDLLEDFI